jgi:membrane protein YqaA with SNARE-associated domain
MAYRRGQGLAAGARVRWHHFHAWLISTLPVWGGSGLLLASFVDCSFLPLPLVTDLLLMELSSSHPGRMPFYVAMASFGSLAGSACVYFVAQKGGEAYYKKRQGHPPGRIRRFVQRYPFASVLFPAAAPFPVPFKPFVIAQGVFHVPLSAFVVGTLVGRGSLFFVEGLLGARYGAEAKRFLVTQKWLSLAVVLGLIVLFFLVRRLPGVARQKHPQTH